MRQLRRCDRWPRLHLRLHPGLRDLKSVLTTDYGLDPTGWSLTHAYSISDDGSTIAGQAINPSGFNEGFVVQLPEPALSAFALAALALLRRRR